MAEEEPIIMPSSVEDVLLQGDELEEEKEQGEEEVVPEQTSFEGKEEEDDDDDDDVGFSLMKWMYHNRALVVAIAILILILRFKLKDIRHRWFAAFMNFFTKSVDAKMEEMKKDVFATLGSVVSHDPSLRKTGGIKILEIGVGTGTNFVHYPEGTHLTVVDPNPHFKKYYDENRKKFPSIQSEDIIVCTGEEMDMVEDNSMDVVVVTLVFCSVQNTEKILKQILRVLAPGGKFYFYEHIQEFDTTNHGLRLKIQNFLTTTGIWPFIFDNCNLNRDMLKAIEATGFSKVQAQRFYSPVEHPIFQIIKPSLRGVAEK